MTVNENFEDQHGRSCLVFSGVKKIADIYDWLFNHYNGYKFAILLDCSKDEFPEPDSKVYVNFLDELQDEVNIEAGFIRTDNNTYKRR